MIILSSRLLQRSAPRALYALAVMASASCASIHIVAPRWLKEGGRGPWGRDPGAFLAAASGPSPRAARRWLIVCPLSYFGSIGVCGPRRRGSSALSGRSPPAPIPPTAAAGTPVAPRAPCTALSQCRTARPARPAPPPRAGRRTAGCLLRPCR